MDFMFIGSIFIILIGILGIMFAREERSFFVIPLMIGIITNSLTWFTIIPTGSVGVVRVFGIIKQQTLNPGFNIVQGWSQIYHEDTKGKQLNFDGEEKIEVIASSGVRWMIDVSIPMRVNPKSVAEIASKVQGGRWRTEISSIIRSTIRDNVTRLSTFEQFQARRALTGVYKTSNRIGAELKDEVQSTVNRVFKVTYGIKSDNPIIVGEILIRDVDPPVQIIAAAAELEAAAIAVATERKLNEVEEIRVSRRNKEGRGYAELFSFRGENAAPLTASSAADFLRAAAEKTRADASAYQARTLADAISSAMKSGTSLPNVIIGTGINPVIPMGGNSKSK